MPTATQRARKSTTRPQAPDAIDLLIDDHEKVKKLFKEFEKLAKKGDVEGKLEVAEKICEELTLHAQLEEEIFYPTARSAIQDDNLMNEAEVEHASAKDLIAQILAMSGDDEMFDATVKVLSEYINHHVAEEEGQMFEKARKKKMDLEALAVQMIERKEELTAQVA